MDNDIMNAPIPEPFRRITEQNHQLIREMQSPDFDGFIRLDPTLNRAINYIHDANEIIAQYPQGAFPTHFAYATVYSTMHLLKECEKRYGRVQVKPMTQAFRKTFRLWFYTGKPRHPSELFAKKLFQLEDSLITAICDHNRSIVEANAQSKCSKKNPRAGTGLHGKRTKEMATQLSQFVKYLETFPIFEPNSDKTIAARANQFWTAHAKTFAHAAHAKGEKRGYPNAKAIASAYRASCH